MKQQKKAQLWGMDLMIASIIFTLTIFLFFIYTLNSNSETEITFEKLSYEGGIITDTLLTQGNPTNWNNDTVTQIGILSKGKINQTKIEQLYNLTLEDYERAKRLFNTKYEFYFFLDRNMSMQNNNIDGIGKPGYHRNNISGENLIRISRITTYQNKPTGATLYIWN